MCFGKFFKTAQFLHFGNRGGISGGTGHAGRVTGGMPHGMDDNLGVRGFVENQIRVRRGRHPADRRIARAGADVGILQQKIGEGLNAGVNPGARPAANGRRCNRGSR